MKLGVKAAALAAACAFAAPSEAAIIFVGSWTVDQGPSWTTAPQAYTGQEAAALLFGGSASDYQISTVDSDVASINRLSWISTWGVSGGQQVADDFKQATDGAYLVYGDTSAYVRDNAIGETYTNYAFRVSDSAVPEPAAWAMMIGGFALAGTAMRRRHTGTTVTFA